MSENGPEALAKLYDGLIEGWTVDNFDPLAFSYSRILYNGIVLLGDRAASMEGCLVCYTKEEAPKRGGDPEKFGEAWIELAADDALAKWKGFRDG